MGGCASLGGLWDPSWSARTLEEQCVQAQVGPVRIQSHQIEILDSLRWLRGARFHFLRKLLMAASVPH